MIVKATLPLKSTIFDDGDVGIDVPVALLDALLQDNEPQASTLWPTCEAGKPISLFSDAAGMVPFRRAAAVGTVFLMRLCV